MELPIDPWLILLRTKHTVSVARDRRAVEACQAGFKGRAPLSGPRQCRLVRLSITQQDIDKMWKCLPRIDPEFNLSPVVATHIYSAFFEFLDSHVDAVAKIEACDVQANSAITLLAP